MQSQQKKVKWSRGETADALEERTDTGITEVSVAKLENIVADIYGNIARRPAFKIIESDPSATDLPIIEGFGTIDAANFGLAPQSFVFTVDESTYIIFIVCTGMSGFGGLLIRDGKFVKRVAIDNQTGLSIQTGTKPISAAQYNNFMVVSNLYSADVVLRLTGSNDITVEPFQFSGPWASPNGTKTKTVSSTNLPGLEFNKDGLGFTGYAWTDDAGTSSPYSQIDTGLTGSAEAIAEEIPVGSIVKFPNLGAYMRIEGYYMGGHTIYLANHFFDSATINEHPTPTGLCVDAWLSDHFLHLTVYNNGVRTGESVKISLDEQETVWVQNSASQTGYSSLDYSAGGWDIDGWDDVTPGSLEVRAFGPLLTPAADESVKDSLVTVEYGYVSTDDYNPTQFVFSDQRLYAARFESTEMSPQLIPGFAVGSQIGRFTDFKNDYNSPNEAVTIDISTAYQEQIVSMIDYNGLKIFTDSAEYAYKGGAIIKQSGNGSLSTCDPIVVSGVCIYADKSGQQLRALQYEFQSDLFKSTSINQLAKEDLIFNTTSMASMLDKEHYSGRFLYAPQHKYNFANPLSPVPYAEHSLAVCNFVPGNQAMIWGRWTSPTIRPNTGTRYENKHSVANVVEVNNKVWFIMACASVYDITGIIPYRHPAYTLVELDYDNLLDLETTATPTDTDYQIIKSIHPDNLYAWATPSDPLYSVVYTKTQTPAVGDPIYDGNDEQISTVDSYDSGTNEITYTNQIDFNQYTGTYDSTKNIYAKWVTMCSSTVSVFDGDTYKWDDTLNEYGELTQSIAELTNPRIGFKIDALLESHPIDIQGKTYTEKKRIGKTVAVIRDTEPGAFTVCDKTGYTSPDKKTVNFYGCTGMKDQVRYIIKNIQGAKFTIESLTMIIEYGTLDS